MYKVVIIDDEALSRIGMRSMLDWEKEGFEIIGEAASGKEGLKLVLEKDPDMVISDIVMPGMDGLEMYGEILKAGLDPVFVVLSSYDQFDLVKKAMKMGAADYLLKLSVSPETLRDLFVMTKEKLAERKNKGSGDPERTVWETEELRKAYFTNLLMGGSPETDIEKLGIDFDFSCMRILYVSVYNKKNREQKKEADTRIYIETLRVLIEEICVEFGKSYCIPWYNDFVILLSDSENVRMDKENIRSLADAVILSLREYGNVQSSIGVSRILDGSGLIPEEFETVKEVFSQMPDSGSGEIFFCEDHSQELNRAAGENYIVREAKKYIKEHLYDNIGLREVSGALYLNPSYLSSVFSKQESCGLINYINKIKIREACRLLTTGNMKIYEISFKLGYENASYFTKVFRKHTGKSPKKYLETYRKE